MMAMMMLLQRSVGPLSQRTGRLAIYSTPTTVRHVNNGSPYTHFIQLLCQPHGSAPGVNVTEWLAPFWRRYPST